MKRVLEETVKKLDKLCKEMAEILGTDEFHISYKRFYSGTDSFRIVACPDLYIEKDGEYVLYRTRMVTGHLELNEEGN